MKRPLRLILPVIFYLLNFSVYPQELWIGPSIKIDLPKKLEVSLEQQIRLDESITSYKSMFAELGVGYEINKHFKFKGAYRFTDRPGKYISTERPENNRERITVDFQADFGKKKYSVSYRLRYQATKEKISGKQFNFIRNKVELKYNLDKIAKPYLSSELYYRLNDKNEIRVLRFTFGLDSRITKKLSLGTFYRVEREFNVDMPDKDFIIGLLFTYKLKID